MSATASSALAAPVTGGSAVPKTRLDAPAVPRVGDAPATRASGAARTHVDTPALGTTRRRGRDRFARVKPALVALAAVLGVLPRGVAVLVATLARHVPTEIGIALRWSLVRRLAARCGDCVAIHDGVFLFRLERASFGANVSVHPMCYLDATGGLAIGDDVSIAHGVSILTTEHDWTVPGVATRDAAVTAAPVTIGDDVWIGAGARILAGITIGDHAVVGAGAVVTRDVAPRTIVVGVPARPLPTATTQAVR